MKTPIYVIVLLVLVLVSCSKDNVDTDIVNQDFNVSMFDEQSKALSKPDVPQDQNVCFRTQLLDAKLATIGYVDFSIIDENVVISFKTDGTWNLQETYLDVISCISEVFPLDSYGNPKLDEFKYSSIDKFPVKRVDHVLDAEDIMESICYAGYAIVVDQYGKSKEVWAHGWEMYTPAYLKSCLPDGNDDVNTDDVNTDDGGNIEYCDDNNKKAYICHNGQTICVSLNAIDAHLAHGDTLGQCD